MPTYYISSRSGEDWVKNQHGSAKTFATIDEASIYCATHGLYERGFMPCQVYRETKWLPGVDWWKNA